MPIKIRTIVRKLLLQRQCTWKIMRGEDVPLHLAEDDLDLIDQLAGVGSPSIFTVNDRASDATQLPNCLGACVEPWSEIRWTTCRPVHRAL